MTNTEAAGDQTGNYNLQLILAWLLVGIPLVWGIWKAVLNALPLFQ